MDKRIGSILFGIWMILLTLPESWGSESDTLLQARQICMVEAASWSSSSGWMQRFERATVTDSWQSVGEPIRVVLGINGLAWGRGLHTTPSDSTNIKTEGDGKSPAGLFRIPSAFGLASSEEYMRLKIPYRQLTSAIECVDDASSAYYNQIVDTSSIFLKDWTSSDLMVKKTNTYRLGLVIQQNVDPIETNAGSCIFIRIWIDDISATRGSIAMSDINLSEIFLWIDQKKNPLLLQMPLDELVPYAAQWNLPVDWISQLEEPSASTTGLYLR